MDLRNFFEFSVARNRDQVAIIDKEKRFTYGELNEKVNRVASSIQKLGIKKQDRVMVLLKNRIEMIVMYWAVQKVGAIFTPINFRLSQEDILFCIRDIEPKLVVFEEVSEHLIKRDIFKERPIFVSVHSQSESSDFCLAELETQGDFMKEVTKISQDDLSVIYYTSGTTGVPKGVPRTHRNEYASALAHIVQCQYQMFDRTLGIYPLYHVIGLRSLQAVTTLNGMYIVLSDFDSYESLQMIEREKVSCLFLTPTMYHDLVSHPYANSVNYTSLNTLVYSGATISKELITKCNEIMRPERFINHYGSTEIYTFAYCPDIRKKPGSAGKPGIHQSIQVISAKTKDRSSNPSMTVSQGEIGEIIVNMKSPEAFKGYWNRPDLTKLVIKDGWYYTGDLGYFDQDGDLTVIGRVDDMIISGGEKIYPEIVEKVLCEHPKVSEAVIVGEEDERWGNIVVAHIVTTDPSLSFQELDRFCKYHNYLSSYQRPRKYVFTEKIPRTTTGKILRQKLKQ